MVLALSSSVPTHADKSREPAIAEIIKNSGHGKLHHVKKIQDLVIERNTAYEQPRRFGVRNDWDIRKSP